MKRQQPEAPPPAPQVNPTQCKHWWDSVATWIAEVEREAEMYLVGDAVDESAASEILETLAAAKASADCAFGAYHRVTKQAQHLPQPQAQATQQQPSYVR